MLFLADLVQKLKTTLIQFLGNLVVQNKLSQQAVWTAGFPTLFL